MPVFFVLRIFIGGIELASLGRWLRHSFTSFPRHAGYLKPDPSRVAAYRSRLREHAPGATKIFGVSWRSKNAEYGSFWYWFTEFSGGFKLSMRQI